MNENYKRYILISILIGVVVFLICYVFIQPLINFMMPKFLMISSNCISFLSDQIYKNAALMDKNSFDSAFFAILTGFLSGFFIAPLIVSFINKDKFKSVFLKTKKSSLLITLRFLSFFGFLLLIFVVLFQESDHYLNLNFERKMTILSPFFSDQKEKQLFAQWASMKNKEDYILINNILNNCARENNILEPKDLWKITLSSKRVLLEK